MPPIARVRGNISAWINIAPEKYISTVNVVAYQANQGHGFHMIVDSRMIQMPDILRTRSLNENKRIVSRLCIGKPNTTTLILVLIVRPFLLKLTRTRNNGSLRERSI